MGGEGFYEDDEPVQDVIDAFERRFRPSFEFDRTEEQMRSAEASWRRDDRAFFAAGACHILAYAFADRFPTFSITFVKPRNGFPGTHLFATNGKWAFDHNGLMLLAHFLDALAVSYTDKYPGWTADFIPVEEPIEEFCAANDHVPPRDFHEWPFNRADAYIDRALLQGAIAHLRVGMALPGVAAAPHAG